MELRVRMEPRPMDVTLTDSNRESNRAHECPIPLDTPVIATRKYPCGRDGSPAAAAIRIHDRYAPAILNKRRARRPPTKAHPQIAKVVDVFILVVVPDSAGPENFYSSAVARIWKAKSNLINGSYWLIPGGPNLNRTLLDGPGAIRVLLSTLFQFTCP